MQKSLNAPNKSKAGDMTHGPIWKLLVTFAIPLLIGNLFQQLYNTVDSLVVGNFVGTEALAAVGSTTSIVNTLIRFFNGVSIGAGVVISQYYGAGNRYKLHLTVETTMMLTFLLSIVFTFVGVGMVPFMLNLMSTPKDVFTEAGVYLRIYFSGVSSLMIYNMGSGILRAVGDTKRPLIFLCVSSIANILLDLVFVIMFRMGIAGVAYATIISQSISAILVLFVLCITTEDYKMVWKDLRISHSILMKILIIGVPTGLQQAVTAFSNVFVHSYINCFGSKCMAGWSCYSKIDQFLMLPLQSMGQAATTFVGQNIGAGYYKRARRGTRTALLQALGITFITAILLWIFALDLIELFTADKDVIRYGVMFIQMCSLFTMCCCFNQVLGGSLRGWGNAHGPMVIMMACLVGMRQVYLFITTKFLNTPETVGFGYPVGWIACSIVMCLYYLYFVRIREP